MKLPVPVPSVVLSMQFSKVGFEDSLQQTPLAVTFAPPSEVTLPPQVAEVSAILLTDDTVTVGGPIHPIVVKSTWLPYDVSRLFVA